MSDWSTVKIEELLVDQWPGEWGSDPKPDAEGVIVYRSTELDDDGHVRQSGIYRSIPSSKLSVKRLLPGDILLEASGGTPGRPVGRVGLYAPEYSEVAMCSNFLRTLRPKGDACSSYLRWVLMLLHRRPEIWRFHQQTTGMSNLHVRDYLRHAIDVAPSDEQHRISEILSSVDEAIEQTEALIAKTQQIKAGLMHDLFTRGVTPDGQLRPPREKAPHLYKESLLGWIPKEWDMVSVTNLCSQVVDCPHSTPVYVSRGIPCIRTADMLPGELLLDKAFQVSEKTYFDRVARLVPRSGDIIYSREGERLGIASPVGEEKVCLGQRVMLLRADQETDAAFLLWAMNTDWFYRRVVSGLGATTSPHVNVGDIRNGPLPRPPLHEQELIGFVLSGVQRKLQADADDARKLKATKAGLMHDLLTGRVRVNVSEPAST